MDNAIIINKTITFVRDTLSNAEGGHDWWHVYRVWKLSKHIAEKEKVANPLVVELGALLHDIADSKFYGGDETIGPEMASYFLNKQHVDRDVIAHVLNIIRNISFKNSFDKQQFNSKELTVVQDADRLDAIGAIGIARTFNYGGHKGREIYNPEIKPETQLTKEKYKKSSSPTINHFYEKLLLLKDKMNTQTGKKIALKRHIFLKEFLKEFYAEWDGIN